MDKLQDVHLDSSVTAEVKVKLVGVGNVCVHCGASRNVSTSSNLTGKQHHLHLLELGNSI